MAREKKKTEQMYVRESGDGKVMEIHVEGDILPNRVFLQILDVMKENRNREEVKPVVFVVYTPQMLMMVKNAIPSEYYAHVEVRKTVPLLEEGGDMLDAVGL